MELVAEKYKQTEVGLIPSDWQVKTISQISNPVRGGSPRPAGDPRYFNGNYIPWLTVAALTNIPLSQMYVLETESCLTEEGSLHSRILEKGTLIIANSGATLGVPKLLAIKCCANDGIAALLDFDKETNKQYLVYFINTQIKYLREVVATGNGQPNLNTGLIGNIKVPLPPTIDEQAAIANALSDADDLINSLEKLIAKKRNIKQGVMQKLFSTGKLQEIRLDTIVVIRKGEQLNKSDMSDKGTYPALNGGIEPSGYTDKWNTEKDTITISEGGNSCGFVNYSTNRFWLGGHCYAVDLIDTKFPKAYLYQYLKFRQTQVMELRVGSGLPNIQKSSLNNFNIKIHDSLHEKLKVANCLTDMDADINAIENKLEKYRKVKLGMLQNLLTGKIRLK
ncbi:restriction endonuclease subunit S [Aurantibacillus circumpalustris]|uniref:restriction endonuclease subunit S n=1 Tax=Aurantibacillus circumpalustris TaxID=3036359 RepID=UPI00295BE2AB|nr:restriction endonuclease subunit S [Aurantibacillus circumpalustris]